MKKHKSTRQKEQEKLAALLGMDSPKVEGSPYESEDDIAREAESVLAYAADASYFVRKECKSCGRTFAHTRGAIAYCSNPCRAAGLELIGIKWHWLKPTEQRWGPWAHAEPLVVPPDALTLADEYLASIEEEEPETPQPVEVSADSVDVLDLLSELGLD